MKTVILDNSRKPQATLHILKAKFHYAILVADRSEAGRRPASSLLASYIVLDRKNYSSLPVCGQVCDQDSVMEFGL